MPDINDTSLHIDATAYDDPATSGNEGEVTVGGLVVAHPTGGIVSGTGGYTPFLRQDDSSGTTQGFNTSDAAATASSNPAGLDMSASWTHSLQVGDLPVVFRGGVAYYEIRLDLNEPNGGTDAYGNPDSQVGLSELQIYTSGHQATLGDYNATGYETRALGAGFNLVYDLDSGGDKTLVLADGQSGSGRDDYAFYIPVSALGNASATDYFTLFAQFGPNPQEGATFEEFGVQNSFHIDGVKFNDLNGDGIQEANEPGIGGFQMYIDSNGNNRYDAGELTATSDSTGHFTFYGLLAGTYTVRENMTSAQSASYILTTGDSSGGHSVTVTDANASVSVGNMQIVRDFTITKAVTNVTGDTDGDGKIDHAGGVISYLITIENSGTVALTGYAFVDSNATTISGLSGDTNHNGNLDVGETWTYSATHTVTQAELDGQGTGITGAIDGDGDTDNRATASFDIVGAKSGEVSTPLTYDPAIDVTKAVTSVTGADGDAVANHAGDVIGYAITIANTGNISLTGVSVSDAVESYGATDAVAVLGADGSHNSGDANANGVLDVGETWNYTASYTLTQADLDTRGGGDGLLNNTATGDTAQTDPDSASASVPLTYDPAIDVTKAVTSVTGADGDAVANHAGDVIGYAITIANTGNISLTGVSVSDAVESYGATDAVAVLGADGLHNSGDVNANGVLDVGETWNYTASYTLTQADLDTRGGGDGLLGNTATGDTAQTDPDSASASVPLTYDPAIDVTKAVTSVTGADGDAVANHAGDVIGYAITIANTGNISLTGVSVSDAVESYGATDAVAVLGADGSHNSGDVNANGVLDVGETWNYTASYTLTQADLDTRGGGDGLLDNTATGDTAQTDPDSASASVPLTYDPAIDLVKYVSVDGGATWDDANAALGPQDVNLGAPVSFEVTVTNTGNVSLTDLVIDDVNTSNGTNSSVALLAGGTLMDGATITGDVGNDHVLGVGETWTITYTQPFDAGDHVNTATVTTDQGATDTDAAHYYSLPAGPGVRTPGFWSNLGATFWDGNATNQPKQAGTPGFAKGELLYGVDSTRDGIIDTKAPGLLIGDYNHNGVTDAGEDTLFISLKDAQSLINASNKDLSGDARFMLGRDMVATWLNYLAGNGIGSASDPQSAHHYLDQAIDWMQTYSGATGTSSVNNETFDTLSLAANGSIKPSLSSWTGHMLLDGNMSDLTGAQMHAGLDYYNNTGMTSPTSAIYAGDADDSAFISALTLYDHAHLI